MNIRLARLASQLCTQILVLGMAGLLFTAFAWSQAAIGKHSSSSGFRVLMNAIADGWNSGNARKAADCYTEDAIYTEPPDKQVYVGRESLLKFFGDDQKPNSRMQMQWHNLAFDEDSQVGFGEYTFQFNNRYHGVVVVKLRGGKISNWREYQYKSDLSWQEFSKLNPF